MNAITHPQYLDSEGFSDSEGGEQSLSNNYESQEDMISQNSFEI